MDYIEGHPLDTYLSSRSLSVKQILRLFWKICDAVNAAHLHGITHRDLKPSNIRIDKQGEPHILDFGLAKVASEETGDASQWRNVTMTGQFVGSVPWASPEQADGPTDRIDLRTDVYSLGVLLFQMLTGRFPYPIVGPMRVVLMHILETEPVRPSTLRKGLDEDVETIVLKCLAKEPDRRYQSAAALAEDVDRYLTQQPIQARAPSTVYQIRKLVARNKLPFAFVATLFIMVSGFAIWMSVLYARTAAERNRATAAEQTAEQRRAEAEQSAELAQAVNEFLINDMLASAVPEIAQG